MGIPPGAALGAGDGAVGAGYVVLLRPPLQLGGRADTASSPRAAEQDLPLHVLPASAGRWSLRLGGPVLAERPRWRGRAPGLHARPRGQWAPFPPPTPRRHAPGEAGLRSRSRGCIALPSGLHGSAEALRPNEGPLQACTASGRHDCRAAGGAASPAGCIATAEQTFRVIPQFPLGRCNSGRRLRCGGPRPAPWPSRPNGSPRGRPADELRAHVLPLPPLLRRSRGQPAGRHRHDAGRSVLQEAWLVAGVQGAGALHLPAGLRARRWQLSSAMSSVASA
mmetsp:Transcript_44761/g.133735  ORF Transcript_44761/g.133735 Transcript_44761/m.133735 type:complete len:279 (-) Transcript_44761:21-857(-)